MDATFWAFAGLVIFLAIVAYVKVPAMITGALDKRADQIRNELEEAKKLREEAQQLLAEYQRKRKEAVSEAESILSAAEKEAAVLREEAKTRTEEYVSRRTAMAEQKIQQAESQAINEVCASAVDLAIVAAEKLIGAKIDSKASNGLFKASLGELKSRLN
ncbi:F0F1 ATP synthase subunit B [Hoeflea sp. YIM 152468]|uniref:F0F1 ATP synthase subunit B n=1 Tax=Hoeflea sp. YIM 152468 TaxID=3031759 RepID=UPI0023DA4CC7|nr:F0F1 ATP synthase subunit B [Hoeflea sp. YIM 152468]MDF1606628.1 F0F1 ATP synthase subunit B [Hoeflea sp. YIM 152468]